MESFMIGIFVGAVVTAVMLRIALYVAVKRAERTIEALAEAMQKIQANQIQARVEEQNGIFYVYNSTDNSFMAQGASLKELKAKIEQRWKDAQVFVSEGDADVLARLKATQEPADA